MDTVIYSVFFGMLASGKAGRFLIEQPLMSMKKIPHFWGGFKESHAIQSKIFKIMNTESSFKSKLTISVNKV